jgi:hypothetical protein
MTKTTGIALVALSGLLFSSTPAVAQQARGDPFVFGVKIRAGGRYDNVRRCVATNQGTPGGPAADISLFAEIPVGDGKALHVDLPVMRPILFAAAFKMLQFEPTVTLKFRSTSASAGDIGWVAGPVLGVTLHYGPDYKSELSGEKFFAVGPIVGGYVGLDFRRANKNFNFELGITPYFIPLFGVNDPKDHRGVVLGALLDAAFRFKTEN